MYDDKRIKGLRFTDDMMIVDFGNEGASIPIAAYPRLRDATTEQRNNFRIIGQGIGINWPDVDEDLSAQGLFGYASKIEHYTVAPQSGKMCCYSLPLGLHEFSCRAWRP